MTATNQPDSQAGDEQIRYLVWDLVWNLVDHYQNDHPDPDQTEECRFAIETIEELEAHAERLAAERVLEAELQGHRTTATVLQYVINADSGFMGDSKAAAKHWKKQTDKLIAELSATLTKENES